MTVVPPPGLGVVWARRDLEVFGQVLLFSFGAIRKKGADKKYIEFGYIEHGGAVRCGAVWSRKRPNGNEKVIGWCEKPALEQRCCHTHLRETEILGAVS